jgi:predicted TIM-barrel fold metal-dependent hydrolase
MPDPTHLQRRATNLFFHRGHQSSRKESSMWRSPWVNRRRVITLGGTIAGALLPPWELRPAAAQDDEESGTVKDLRLRKYEPRPMLTTEAHDVLRPRFPVIDAHNHLGDAFHSRSDDWLIRPVSDLVATLDESGVRTVVNLDGRWGDRLRAELARYVEPYPDRFVVFSGVDYDNFASDPDFGETEARRLRESVALGARGLKVWKTLGLRLRDTQSRLIPVDDARLDPLWATAAELGVPVLIHVADPVAFFQPLDRFNERWEELHEHPDWHFYPTRPRGDASHADFPSFDEIMEQFESLLRRHPQTIFIGAHAGCYAENLGWVGRVLDACPNFFIDISARIAELGRQPYTARDFFIRHQDRILFGTDADPDPRVYRIYYRFLETRDEYFNYGLSQPPDVGRWMIYGLDLPDEVLEKVYYENAQRVILSGSPAWVT